MKESYLEVTFRHGRPMAAYYHLPREAGQRSVRTRRVEPGLVIDYAMELTARSRARRGPA